MSFSAFSQGSYCSRGIEIPNNEEKSYLSGKIEKSTNSIELILELNKTLSDHYFELDKRNKDFLQEMTIKSGCRVDIGSCGIFAVEVFGYFQDGVFDDFNDFLSTIKDGAQNMSTEQVLAYLKKYYSNHAKAIDISTSSPYTEEKIKSKIREHLDANGKHGILAVSFKLYSDSDDDVYDHAVNVFRFDDKIYYVNDAKPLSTNIQPLLFRRNSGVEKVTEIEIVYIKP